MKRFYCILLFIISFQNLFGENGLPLSNTDGSLSTIVNNCVSIISGDYMESSCDLILQGPEPLIFERFYSSGTHSKKTLYEGFRHNHETEIKTFNPRETNQIEALYTNKNGRQAKYYGSVPLGRVLQTNLKYQEHFGKGYTNCASYISGRNHIKNTSIDKYKNYLKVNGENGSELIFDKYKDYSTFRLTKEITGLKNNFQYKYKDDFLSSISLTDNSGTFLCSCIHFKYLSPKELNKNPVLELEAHDGRKLIYKLKKSDKQQYRIQEVVRPNAPSLKYEYHPLISKISKKKMPKGRFLGIEYFQDNKQSFSYGKVHQLLEPVGHDKTPIVTYSFAYDKISNRQGNLVNGYSYVWDAKGNLTAYIYDQDQRLDTINKYIGGGKERLYSEEKFYWSSQGNLLCHLIKDENLQIRAARAFKYDKRNNVTHDTFYGNLQGGPVNIQFNEKEKCPYQKDCNSWTIFYRYSEDGRNLIVEEVYPSGKIIQYEYDPSRDVVISKFTLEHGQIRIREFTEYDAFGLKICTILDDGTTRDKNNFTSVTERKICRIENQLNVPVGLPKVISEYYFDFEKGREVLLKRIKNSYCFFGNLVSQEIYDLNEELVNSSRFEYDSHGNIILEEDFQKNRTIKKYNKNDQLKVAVSPNKFQFRHLKYDFAGRLINEKCKLKDGTKVSGSFHYDYCGNKIASIDDRGQKTDYIYDAFHRLIQTISPLYVDPNGHSHQIITKSEYDLFGNETKSINALGVEIIKQFNARGKPISIFYPEGAIEKFEYDDEGNLKKLIAKNGLTTFFEYDCFQRVLKEDIYSNSGSFLSSKIFRYNSFHKLEEEVNGQKTTYSYNGFGALKSIKKETSLIEYEYDQSQRISKEKTWINESSYQAKIFNYDSYGHVVEEKIEDEKGSLLSCVRYAYDTNGNRIEETRETEKGISTSKTIYNSLLQPVEMIDAEGNKTYFTYNKDFYNKNGLRVLQVIEENALGIQTLTEMNVFGKPDSIIKKNKFGQIISKKEIGYNGCQSVVFTKDAVLGGLQEKPDIITKYFYNTEGSLILLIEAFGSKEQKTTEFSYNNLQQQIILEKPDGTSIEKTYDALQRLESIKDKSGSFSYFFTYDQHGNLIKSEDLVNGLNILRSYNNLGQMITENFGNEILVQYSYDAIGRPLHVILPDRSSVSYSYNALYLKKCERRLKSGEVLYDHDYLSYDLSGNLLEEKNSTGFGFSSYQYGLNGRTSEIKNDLFCENILYDPLGNVLEIKRNSSTFLEEKNFSYDDLKQLKSETGGFDHVYIHDSLNNCVLQDGNEKKTNSLNQLLDADGKKYSYDANGNRVFDGEKEYRYDALDRLISVSFENSVYVYSYDSFNRRLSKTHKNKEGHIVDEERYLYFGQNEVGSFDKSGKLKEFRMLGTGKGAEIGASLFIELDEVPYFPLHDYHGNILALIDATTLKVKERYTYSAFGKEKIFNDNEEEVKVSFNPWRFSSKRVDEETGFSNFGRRYYDPQTMRWLSPDPIGFEGGPNLYAYVMNNPLSLYDLYGLEAVGSSQRWTADRLGRAVKDAIGYCVRGIGNLIQRTISFAKDLFKSAPERVYYNKSYEDPLKEQSRNIVINGYNESTIPGIEIGLTNGMCNTDKFASGNAGILSKIAKDVRSVLTYSNTFGIVHDVLKTLKTFIGRVATHDSTKLYDKWVAFFKENPDGHYLEVCHSRGVTVVLLALMVCPEEMRQRIHVLAIAPATYIPDELCGSIQHYVSTRDFVPLFNLKGMVENRQNITFLKPHKDAPLFDHGFSSPTYAKVIKDEVKTFIKMYRK